MPAVADRQERRPFGTAFFSSMGKLASWVEGAPWWYFGEVGRVARAGPQPLPVPVDLGQAGEKAERVGMPRRTEARVDLSGFHHAPGVPPHPPLAHLRDHPPDRRAHGPAAPAVPH